MKTAKLSNNYNVGIYCRLSKDDSNGGDESASISHQRDMLIKYVQEKGWNLTKIYTDDGYSGVNFDRPDFKAMIKDIEDCIINCVVVKDLSRLGRNYAMTGQYTDNFFPDNNIRFIAINDSIDSDVENDITPFKHVLNEMYAKDISRKTRSGKKTLSENGKFNGPRPPYGYKRSQSDRHTFEIDEVAAGNVRRIYEMFLGGKSGRLIGDILNREEMPSPNAYFYASQNKPNPNKNQSDKWGSGTIMNIIRNPVYKGVMVNGKRRVTSFKNKKVVRNSPDTWIVVEDTHEPIINQSVWDEAQKIVAKNHVGIRRGGSGAIALFSGVVKCADCGAKMTFNRKVYKDYTKEYYRCGRYTNKGTDACKPHTILEGAIYKEVIEDIRAYAKFAYNDEQQLINRLSKDNVNHSYKQVQRQEKLLKDKERRLSDIDLLVQSLFEEKINGTVPENIFKRMAKKYDDEQLNLAKEIETLKNDLADLKRNESDITSWVSKIKRCLSIEALTRELVVELIDSIEISEVYEKEGQPQQDVNITYRFENISNKDKKAS